MECLFLIIICDEHRRPRRGAPAADHIYKQICKYRTAPPCLREALRRGALIELHGLMIFMVRV